MQLKSQLRKPYRTLSINIIVSSYLDLVKDNEYLNQVMLELVMEDCQLKIINR